MTIPWMALVPLISGVCSIVGTFEMTSTPTNAASTKMVSSTSSGSFTRPPSAAAAT